MKKILSSFVAVALVAAAAPALADDTGKATRKAADDTADAAKKAVK